MHGDIFAQRVTFARRHFHTEGDFCTRVIKKQINKQENKSYRRNGKGNSDNIKKFKKL